MHLEEDDANDLKAWVVTRLETIGADADSDVLADYVLALVRTDTPEPQLRVDVHENLTDFLKDHTTSFVDQVFLAIQSRSYKPGYKPPPKARAPAVPAPASSTGPSMQPNKYGSNLPAGRGAPGQGGLQESRKRSYNEPSGNGPGGPDSHYAPRGDRQMKQMRRGGRGGVRGGFDQGGGSSGGYQPQINGFPPAGSPSAVHISHGFPNMPPIPPEMGDLDPGNPMAAMLAMGMSFLPEMPGYGSSGPQIQIGAQSPGQKKHVGKKLKRCRDYDTKGFCTRGDSCQYLHGNDRVVVPVQDEYDPKDAVMNGACSPVATANENRLSEQPILGGFQADSSRGRGRGRGDRGRGRGGDRGNFQARKSNRADFSSSNPNNDRSITTIVVEQIPEEKFSEESVREFFSEFGSIAETTLQPYKHLALVKYDDYFAARAAYDSPKVIFDNRFVKVYWYKPATVPTPPSGSATYPPTTPLTETKREDSPPFDHAAFAATTTAAQEKLDAKRAALAAMTSKREALEKQKADLAAKQAAEKQKLLDRLAAKGATIPSDSKNDDTTMVDTPHTTTSPPPNGTNPPAANEKASAHTLLLRAKVAELEAEARSLGLDAATSPSSDPSYPTYSPRGRGYRGGGGSRGSYRGWEGFDPSYRGGGGGRGRGSGIFTSASRGGGGKYNLDLRTKRVAVTLPASANTNNGNSNSEEAPQEWTADKDEALRQHLLAIGEFEDIQPLAGKKETIAVVFKERATAEKFLFAGKTRDIGGVGKVELAWHNAPAPPVIPVVRKEEGHNDDGGGRDTPMHGANGNGAEKEASEKSALPLGGNAVPPTSSNNAPQAQAQGHAHATAVEVDYDVAEEDEDDSWMET